MTNQEELIRSWNDRWYSSPANRSFGVPVAYCPNPGADPEDRERYITTTYSMAFAQRVGTEEVAVVRVRDYGQRGMMRLDRLEVLEDVVAKLGQLKKVEGDEAIQHNPECPDCCVEMDWDEGFDCPVCLTHFDDNGEFSYRPCVEYECDEQGDLVGDDGQPRCVTCTVLVLMGEQEPFSPYECKRCKKEVVGIPSRAKAARSWLCGGDQAATDRQEFLDRILNRRY